MDRRMTEKEARVDNPSLCRVLDKFTYNGITEAEIRETIADRIVFDPADSDQSKELQSVLRDYFSTLTPEAEEALFAKYGNPLTREQALERDPNLQDVFTVQKYNTVMTVRGATHFEKIAEALDLLGATGLIKPKRWEKIYYKALDAYTV